MILFRKQTATVPAIWLHAFIAVLSGFLLCGHGLLQPVRFQ
jgi:hypothetical protein